jgi:hypothetical protein
MTPLSTRLRGFATPVTIVATTVWTESGGPLPSELAKVFTVKLWFWPLVAVTVTVHVVPLGPGLQPGELGVSATTVVTFPFCANESEFVAGEM